MNNITDNRSGIIAANTDVLRTRFMTDPNRLVNIPIIIADKNTRFSNVKSSSSAKMKLIAFLIFPMNEMCIIIWQ